MKTITLLFFCCLTVTFTYSQIWREIGEVPTSGTNPGDIHFLTPNFGIAISGNGTFRTVDGGYNWTKIDGRGGGDIVFQDADNLIIITDKNSSATHWSDYNISSDSGKSWTVPYKYIDHPLFATRAHFISSDTAYVILKSKPGTGNRQSKIYKTTDGLSTWTLMLNDTSITEMIELKFIDDRNGYVSAQIQDTIPAIVYTHDAGVSWTVKRMDSIDIKINDLEVVNKNTAFVTSLFGKRLYKTTDAWNTYKQVFTDTTYDILNVKFPSENLGYAHVNSHASGKTEIYTSTNLGESWQFQDTLPANFNAAEFFFLNDTIGWILGRDRRVLAIHKNTADTSGNISDTNTTGVSFIRQQSPIDVFPNPCKNILMIKTDNHVAYDFSIVDLFGKILYQDSFKYSISIDVGDYSKGTYFYFVRDDHGFKQTGRIVKIE